MAKNTKSANVKLNLEVEISSAANEVFEDVAPGAVKEYLTTCVENYLSAYANGGLMLSEADLEQIGQAIGEAVSSSSDIVNAVQGRKPDSDKNQNGVFEVRVDPSLVSNIQASADVLGISMQQWLENCWGHIIANGWLYGISGDIRWIPFELSKIVEAEKLLGKPLDSSSSICNALTEQAGVNA